MEEKSKDYFVAYLDVMGFTEMVTSHKTDKIDSYVQTLETELWDLIDKEYKAIEFFTISDTIVLLSEYNKENHDGKIASLRVLLQVVQKIQAILALKNIWLRGAISFGLVWFDKKRNILIGKGYINAYNLEKEALYFRVILDPKIILELNTSGLGIKHIYNQGKEFNYASRLKLIFSHIQTNTYQNMEKIIEEDAVFVDYGYLLVKSINSENWGGFFTNLKNNLYSDQKTYNKYLWLKRYLTHSFLEAEQNASSTADPGRKGFVHNYYSQMFVL